MCIVLLSDIPNKTVMRREYWECGAHFSTFHKDKLTPRKERSLTPNSLAMRRSGSDLYLYLCLLTLKPYSTRYKKIKKKSCQCLGEGLTICYRAVRRESAH